MRGYFNCKFCKGRGCLACDGEREKDRIKDEKAMEHSFNNPMLVIKGTPDEDPVGSEEERIPGTARPRRNQD
jgi:hypothetical protein